MAGIAVGDELAEIEDWVVAELLLVLPVLPVLGAPFVSEGDDGSVAEVRVVCSTMEAVVVLGVLMVAGIEEDRVGLDSAVDVDVAPAEVVIGTTAEVVKADSDEDVKGEDIVDVLCVNDCEPSDVDNAVVSSLTVAVIVAFIFGNAPGMPLQTVYPP